MQEAVKSYVKKCQEEVDEKNKAHGFTLIDMPTGTGKTYNTLLLIEKYLRGHIFQDVEKVIYLTPLNKNINEAYEKLRGKFSQDEKNIFDNNVLWVKANYQSVIDELDKVEDQISSDFKKKDSYKDLINYLNAYSAFENMPNSDCYQISRSKQVIEDLIRTKYEPAFREDIKRELSRLYKNKTSKLNKIVTDWPWLLKLYPSILTDKRKVLFMSVDKFISGNDPIISQSYRFINSPMIKGSLIFIDEVDAAKEFILRNQIDSATQKKIDLIKLFSTITGTLASDRRFPTAMFPEINSTDKDKSSKAIFSKMEKVLLKKREDFHLNYPFKLEDESNEDEHVFLFEDHQLHTISNTKENKCLTIQVDEKKQVNLIKKEKSDVDNKDDGKFYRMIYNLNGGLAYILKGFVFLSRNYLKFKNDHKKNSSDDDLEADEAASTMLAPFELDDKLASKIIRMVVDDFNFPYSSQSKSIVDTDFYLNGFRFFDFEDDRSHDTTTTINMCYLNETPEKFLFTLASKAMVVGISATASIETVTGNFNLDFLRSKLGKSYYEITDEDKNRILNNIKQREAEQTYNITINIMKSCDDEYENLAKQVFNDKDNQDILMPAFDELDKNENKSENKNRHWGSKRYVKTLMAIKNFILNPKSKALLVLANNNLRSGDGLPYSDGEFKKLIDLIRKENHIEKEVKMLPLNGNIFEHQKSIYKEEIKKGFKVILFSSYPTAGTGQNLQYSILDGESEQEKEKDIDSLYLEKPTNILVNMMAKRWNRDNPLTPSDLVKYIYQAESLRNSGEISLIKSNAMIKKAFKIYGNGETKSTFNDNRENEYLTNSVNNQIVRTLEQAVGRICRTGRESTKEDVTIYVDDEISKVNFECVKGKPMNKEFRELISKIGTTEPVQKDEIILLNKGAERSERLEREINSILSESKDSWTEKDMERWGELRNWVLRHPTCSKKEASDSGFDKLYFESRPNMPLKRAYYKNKGNDNRCYKLSYSESKECNCEISEFNSKLADLMKNRIVFNYFKKQGFAVNFEKNECILNPVAYTNIYKGALGEVAGLAILETCGIKLASITDPEKFEKFDFCLEDDKDIYIDFKNWNENDQTSDEEYTEKIENKLQLIHGKKAFIINILTEENFRSHDKGKIFVIPNLLKSNNFGTYVVDTEQITLLIKKITEAKKYGHN